MFMHTSPHKKGILLFFVLLLVLGVGAFAMLMQDAVPSVPGIDEAPRETTLTGISTCLPHKNTGGPTTLECAFGIRTDDGVHYALDMSDVQGMHPGWDMQGRLMVKGTLVPIEFISTDHWSKYDIRGIMRVREINAE